MIRTVVLYISGLNAVEFEWEWEWVPRAKSVCGSVGVGVWRYSRGEPSSVRALGHLLLTSSLLRSVVASSSFLIVLSVCVVSVVGVVLLLRCCVVVGGGVGRTHVDVNTLYATVNLAWMGSTLIRPRDQLRKPMTNPTTNIDD